MVPYYVFAIVTTNIVAQNWIPLCRVIILLIIPGTWWYEWTPRIDVRKNFAIPDSEYYKMSVVISFAGCANTNVLLFIIIAQSDAKIK